MLLETSEKAKGDRGRTPKQTAQLLVRICIEPQRWPTPVCSPSPLADLLQRVAAERRAVLEDVVECVQGAQLPPLLLVVDDNGGRRRRRRQGWGVARGRGRRRERRGGGRG